MAYIPPSQPGERHPKIPGAKKFLSRYSYGKGLGTTDEYTVEFGLALRTWAPRFNAEVDKGRAGPKVPTDGSFDWTVIRQMGLDEKAPNTKPLILTAMGHLGIIDGGPEYLAARPLEVAGKVQIQMVGGFDNSAIPFKIGPQYAEMTRLLHEPQLNFANRTWAISTHSRGALVWGKLYQERDFDDPIWKTFRGGVQFGDPKRPRDVVAPWIASRPDPGTRGLDPWCHTAAIPGVAEATQHKDLYGETKDGTRDTELKTAIIKLVAYGQLFGHDSITEELLSLMTQFGSSVWPLFQAITGGLQFAVNMSPHTVFDLAPATRHLATVLGV